jgi:hypothetical protein
MASSRKRRSSVVDKYGGSPCELPESDLPTFTDIARYFYFVSLSESDYNTQIHLVKWRLMEVWAKCNPRLPLLEKSVVFNRLKKFVDKVKSYNQKYMKPAPKKVFLAKKDKLFDISVCICTLPTVPCNSKYIRCDVVNCQTEHIACECSPELRVPVEEREYIRDQRSKIGTRGTFQLGSVDRIDVAKEKAKEQRLNKQPRLRAQRLEQVSANPVFEVCEMYSTVLYCTYLPRVYTSS